jgi:TolB-like protein/class 3 adenylate cyclase/Tfp pilus assembly protein PilF
MKQPVERRLVAVFAADVAGYSRLMGADEEGTLERLKAHRRKLIDPKISEHRGRIVKTTGDGLLAEFPSVVDAVRCAVEIQRGMTDRNAEVPEDQRITFRIGINLGDVIIDGDDIYGDGVNIAARLETLAEPGGICVARTVRNQIRDKLPYPFEDIGEQNVKNIARPVRADAMSAAAVASTPRVAPLEQANLPPHRLSLRLAVAAASIAVVIAIGAAAWWAWPNRNSPTVATQASAATTRQPTPATASTTAPRLSIVVLPFANLSNDPEQEYFADGITDDLTTDLSRIDGSFVIARNTAFTYKGKQAEVRQIARELGVRYVLEGSVRRLGERVQVNVQLIDGETGAHAWADRFDTDRRDLVEAQSEITGRLARTLQLGLIEETGRRIENDRAVDPDARDLIMRGWARYYQPYSLANRKEALQTFERALEIDPRSTDARIGVALILTANISDIWSSSVERDEARAEELLLEALERDANRSMAHATMGLLRRVENRWAEAKVELERAIVLDRNNTWAIRQLGQTLVFMGQPETAIPHLEKALRLSPREASVPVTYAFLGWVHIFLDHMDEAMDFFRKARAENPRLWYRHLWYAGAMGLRGDTDGARTEIAESLKLKPEIDSIARTRALPSFGNPQFQALMEKTFYAGLRRAGFPDE